MGPVGQGQGARGAGCAAGLSTEAGEEKASWAVRWRWPGRRGRGGEDGLGCWAERGKKQLGRRLSCGKGRGRRAGPVWCWAGFSIFWFFYPFFYFYSSQLKHI